MKQLMKIAVILLLLSSIPFLSAQDAPKPVAAETSVWDTTFGVVTLVQEGAFITGTYPYSEGKLIAAVCNGVIYGFWWENDDKTGCGPDNAWCGPFVLYLSSDGKSFKGFYDKASRGITRISQVGSKWKWDGTLKSGKIIAEP
jgi:hypothetical protein